jgi:cytochrome c oxidase subunit 2
VIHSFFVPEFRVKRDVVPGMYTTLWFEATDLGEYQALCTEYCGAQGPAGHFNMLAKVRVVTWEEYQEFVGSLGGMPAECEGEENPEACWGEKLYTKNGCTACHATEGAMRVGPNFNGLFGKTETFTDGSSAVVDENYLRESILNPSAKIVPTPSGAPMPPFPNLSDDEINALIAFIKSFPE